MSVCWAPASPPPNPSPAPPLPLPLPAWVTPPACSALHEHFPVVPGLIRDYIQQVQEDLCFITASPGGWPSSGLSVSSL